MIWGAYIEAAANMGHVLWTLMRHPEALAETRKETRGAFTSADVKTADPSAFSLGRCFEKLTYCEAVVKETLRVVPQTAGGYASTRRRESSWVTTCPPGTCSPPTRASRFWIRKTSRSPKRSRPSGFWRRATNEESRGKLRNATRVSDSRASDPDAYFPGGVGQHKCPGISLSTLMTQIFLVYATSAFDGWAPDESDEGSFDPEYVQIPIVIIDDKYRLSLEKNWQYESERECAVCRVVRVWRGARASRPRCFFAQSDSTRAL